MYGDDTIALLPSLRSLSIWMHFIRDSTYLLLPSIPSLTSLYVGASSSYLVRPTSARLVMGNMISLRYLHLKGVHFQINRDPVVWHPPSLESVVMSAGSPYTRLLLSSSGISLQSLFAQELDQNDIDLIATECQHLTTLHFTLRAESSHHERSALSSVATITTLRDLCIRSMWEISTSGWMALTNLTLLTNLSTTPLVYDGCAERMDAVLQSDTSIYPLIYHMAMSSPLLLVSTMPQSLSSTMIPMFLKELPSSSSPLISAAASDDGSLESKEPIESSISLSSSQWLSYATLSTASLSRRSWRLLKVNNEDIAIWLYRQHYGKYSRDIHRVRTANNREHTNAGHPKKPQSPVPPPYGVNHPTGWQPARGRKSKRAIARYQRAMDRYKAYCNQTISSIVHTKELLVCKSDVAEGEREGPGEVPSTIVNT
jgi:hypothetical protein